MKLKATMRARTAVITTTDSGMYLVRKFYGDESEGATLCATKDAADRAAQKFVKGASNA